MATEEPVPIGIGDFRFAVTGHQAVQRTAIDWAAEVVTKKSRVDEPEQVAELIIPALVGRRGQQIEGPGLRAERLGELVILGSLGPPTRLLGG